VVSLRVRSADDGNCSSEASAAGRDGALLMKSTIGVGTQWELRRALARTDKSVGHYHASVRAHVDRRCPRVIALSGSFSNHHGQKPLRIKVLDAKR
jgi:hypothetical protein